MFSSTAWQVLANVLFMTAMVTGICNQYFNLGIPQDDIIHMIGMSIFAATQAIYNKK